jgi:hypothetical protein
VAAPLVVVEVAVIKLTHWQVWQYPLITQLRLEQVALEALRHQRQRLMEQIPLLAPLRQVVVVMGAAKQTILALEILVVPAVVVVTEQVVAVVWYPLPMGVRQAHLVKDMQEVLVEKRQIMLVAEEVELVRLVHHLLVILLVETVAQEPHLL